MELGWRLWQSLATIWESTIITPNRSPMFIVQPPMFLEATVFLLSVSPTYSLQIQPDIYLQVKPDIYLQVKLQSFCLFPLNNILAA